MLLKLRLNQVCLLQRSLRHWRSFNKPSKSLSTSHLLQAHMEGLPAAVCLPLPRVWSKPVCTQISSSAFINAALRDFPVPDSRSSLYTFVRFPRDFKDSRRIISPVLHETRSLYHILKHFLVFSVRGASRLADHSHAGFDQGMLNKLNISATASPSESIYGSPGGTRNGHESSTHSGQYAGAAILVSHTRPTNSRNFGGIVVPCKPSSDASPNRLEFINEISNWRPVSDGSNGDFQRGVTFRAGNFVHPAGNEADDVFGTSRDGETQGQGKLDSCILLIIALTVKGDDSNRPDGTGEAISNDNAQALLPPSACVFVAK